MIILLNFIVGVTIIRARHGPAAKLKLFSSFPAQKIRWKVPLRSRP
jgi:hypothetical protein